MQRRTSWFSFLTVIVILSTLLSACVAPAGAPATGGETQAEAGTPKAGGTLTVALNGEIDTIDPHLSARWDR